MASIKAGVNAFLKAQSAITSVVGTRIYHRDLEQDPTYPALTYTLISDFAIQHTYDQKVGPRRARFQIDVFSESVATSDNLMESIYSILAGYQGAMGSFTAGGVFDLGQNPEQSFKDEKTLKWVEHRSRDFAIVYYS